MRVSILYILILPFSILAQNDRALFREGNELFDSGKYVEAIEKYDAVSEDEYLEEANYNKENNRVRTPETHLLFELTNRTTGLCENKKSGTLSQNEMDSALVGNEGLEPPTSSL